MSCFWGAGLTPFHANFGKENSFPNFVERSILKLLLSKLCAVPLAIENKAVFEGRQDADRMGRKRGDQQGGQREKRSRENHLFKTCDPDGLLENRFRARPLGESDRRLRGSSLSTFRVLGPLQIDQRLTA